MTEIELIVRCYSGQTYAESPTSFLWQGIEHRIMHIENAWLEPVQRHFLVLTEKDQRMHLSYDEAQDRWSLLSYK
jgi:hypothetical protein